MKCDFHKMLCLLLFFAPCGLRASVNKYPFVDASGRVSFELSMPNAKKVEVKVDALKSPLPMTKNKEGMWHVTSEPFSPNHYAYSFIVDSVEIIDPKNNNLVPNLLSLRSSFSVAHSSPMPWEWQDVPHGVIHRHTYYSSTLNGSSEYYVYTPPSYNSHKGNRLPVLYLLHGYSDDAWAWSEVGKANLILDNLIASKKVKPMIVVMPTGYGKPEILHKRWNVDADIFFENSFEFMGILSKEIMPMVDRQYLTSKKQEEHAIAGLSMGGLQALLAVVQLKNKFAFAGAFSAPIPNELQSAFLTGSNPENINKSLRLLWISCGKEDFLFDDNQKFKSQLNNKGVHFVDITTEGNHRWSVWRENLVGFLPHLFQK